MARPQTTSDAFNDEQYEGGIVPTSTGTHRPNRAHNLQKRPPRRSNSREPGRSDANKISQRVSSNSQHGIERWGGGGTDFNDQLNADQTQGAQDKAANTRARVRMVRFATAFSGGFIWVWLFCQVPFAVLTLIFLGLSYAMREGTNTVYKSLTALYVPEKAAYEFTNWLTSWGGTTVIATIDSLFFICLIVVIVVGLLQIFSTMLILILTGSKPMSGKGAVVKFVTLIGCVVGYVIPGANLFPWIGFYMLVMIMYPR